MNVMALILRATVVALGILAVAAYAGALIVSGVLA